MIGSVPARWLLSAVFAAAMAGASLAWRGSRASGIRSADRGTVAFCIVMCGACLGMVWASEPAFLLRAQAVAFGCAAVWFVRLGRTGLRHAVMAGAMVWMLLAIPAPMGGTQMAGPSAAVITVSSLVAACCAITAIPWLAHAIRARNPAAAGHAIMGAGMAALLIAMF